MSMTKADIVRRVHGTFEGLSRREAARYVEAVFEAMKTALERGEKVKISGFGNFVVRQKGARPGRNPRTGQDILITPRKVLVFRPSQILKAALNPGRSPD